MKILYIIHQFYPEFETGTEKIFLNIARMAQKFGHKVKILCYSYCQLDDFDSCKDGLAAKEYFYQGIPVTAIRHRNAVHDPYYALENRVMSKMARQLVSREQPDIVHVAHTMRITELVRVLPQLDISYILTLTDFFLICPKYTLLTTRNLLCAGPEGGRACPRLCPEFLFGIVARRLEISRSIVEQAAAVTTLSNFQASILKREFPDTDIAVVNPGLRYSRLKRNRRHYSRGDRIVFGFAGSINAHKGIHMAIDAFCKIESDAAEFRIYGSGMNQEYVDKISEETQQNPAIRLMGVFAEHEIGDIMTDVDVMVIPSLWYETYCMIMHEAIACCVPVVASRIGVLADFVADGESGYLFEPGDVDALAAIMRRIAADPGILNVLKTKIGPGRTPTVEQEAYQYNRLYTAMI